MPFSPTISETQTLESNSLTNPESNALASPEKDRGTQKPKLRGWIHAGTTPLVLIIGITLLILTPTIAGRGAVTVFVISALLLFGNSAVYHIGNGPMPSRVTTVLRRIDHANIFLLIAGTYTPLGVLLLPTRTAIQLLVIVWAGALAGLLMRVFWTKSPTWVYVPVYIALGWVAIGYMNQITAFGGLAVAWLIIAGGVAYTLGAIVYGLKRPNPAPQWFGYHEIFHVGTVLGFACHTVAIFLAALR